MKHEHRTTWLDRVRGANVVEIAKHLALAVSPRGHFGPCPFCTAKRRHPKRSDRRFACGVRADRRGWRCFECELGGDAIDLVAAYINGRRFRDLGASGRESVREWFERIEPHALASSDTVEERFPDPAELARFWRACRPVSDDDVAAAYLRARGADPDRIAARDLARALGPGASAPWARFRGASWASSGLRLIVPLFDARGAPRSVLARRVAGDGAKSVAPSGLSRRKLVMADELARCILERGAIAPEWARVRVAVCEGEIDFLVAACQVSDADEDARAIFGVTSGSWCDEIAARVPDGAELAIATDQDRAGENYARTIVDSFAGRAVTLGRWRPT